MSQTDLDRNEAATPHKLDLARSRGQVARSQDVTALLVFVVAMVFMTWQGAGSWLALFRFDQRLIAATGGAPPDGAALLTFLGASVRQALLQAVPFFVTLVIAAVAGSLMQTGPVLSLDPIQPDWTRLNPATGLKRLFSGRTLFLLLRSLLKLGLLVTVVYGALMGLLPQFFQVSGMSPHGQLRVLLDDLSSLGLKMSGILALIAALDLIYTKREFAQKMRMSRRDIRDEAKNRDGDPRIRARLRELRKEMLKRSLAVRRTAQADVIVTNPTHYAVALRYVHGQMVAPQLIAKGQGLMAAAMRQIAAKRGIPVVQSPALARALFRELPIDSEVPPHLYSQVARIVVWVFARRKAGRGDIEARHEPNSGQAQRGVV